MFGVASYGKRWSVDAFCGGSKRHGHGWVFIPESVASVDKPHVDNTLPGDLPPDEEGEKKGLFK